MNSSTQHRRRRLAGIVAGATLVVTTGCSTGGMSLASMNPFSRGTSTASEPSMGSKFTESIASTTLGARNQLSTMGTTAKSAFGKTKTAVGGFFGKEESDAEVFASTDPLSLDNQPVSVGPEVFVANGQLWESTGNFSKAMESYTKALESEPNNGPALTSIARLHFRQGNHAQAAEFFQQAIKQRPEDAGLYNDLGLTLSKLSDHAGAEQALERALELAPGTSRYANNLASVKFESGNNDGAFQVLSQNNKPPVAHFNMAYLHFKRGQMDQARTHLSQVIAHQNQAAGDSAVQRAVDRSREMLAQIDGTMSTIAQAGPQATIAARQLLGADAPATGIQQTSQSTPMTFSANPPTMGMPVTTMPTMTSSSPIAPTAPAPTAPAVAPRSGTSTAPASAPPQVPFSLPSGFTPTGS